MIILSLGPYNVASLNTFFEILRSFSTQNIEINDRFRPASFPTPVPHMAHPAMQHMCLKWGQNVEQVPSTGWITPALTLIPTLTLTLTLMRGTRLEWSVVRRY